MAEVAPTKTKGVNYEVYVNGQPVRWGNCTISYNDSETSTVFESIRKHVAKATGLPADGIRIVNMWDL